jgi:hypothetical protein
MNAFDPPGATSARGISRRQLLRQFGGGLVGATLVSLGLSSARSYGQSLGSTSLRDLLGRISPDGCDASQGIKRLLPGVRPAISIRDVARRFGNSINNCRGVDLVVRTQRNQLGGRVLVDGGNCTPGGLVQFQFEGIPGHQGPCGGGGG